jgi:hypothetical protein
VITVQTPPIGKLFRPHDQNDGVEGVNSVNRNTKMKQSVRPAKAEPALHNPAHQIPNRKASRIGGTAGTANRANEERKQTHHPSIPPPRTNNRVGRRSTELSKDHGIHTHRFINRLEAKEEGRQGRKERTGSSEMLPWRLSKTCFMYRRSQLPYRGFSVVGGEGKGTAVSAAASPSGEAQYSPMSRGAVLVSPPPPVPEVSERVGRGALELVAWPGGERNGLMGGRNRPKRGGQEKEEAASALAKRRRSERGLGGSCNGTDETQWPMFPRRDWRSLFRFGYDLYKRIRISFGCAWGRPSSNHELLCFVGRLPSPIACGAVHAP